MKIAIIGGGLAGIAAAHTLLADSKRDVEVHLIEAQGRYGGRACTDSRSIKGFAFDLGAQYLQDPSINPLVGIAKRLGYTTTTEQADYKLRIETDKGWESVPTVQPKVQAVVDAIDLSYQQAQLEPNVRVTPPQSLDTVSDWLGHATSPFGPYTESAETWQYIAADRAREAEPDMQDNLFVNDGIGSLVAAYGNELRQQPAERYVAHLNCAVTRVTYTDKQVQLSFNGQTLTVDACIVTVPVSILGGTSLVFDPPLPDKHRAALKVLRLGSYKKLAFKLRNDPTEIVVGTNYYLYQPDPKGVWQYYRLPYAPDVLCVHTAGDFAATLDRMRDADVYNLFKTRLAEAYTPAVFFSNGRTMSHWNTEPYSLGAYSYSAFTGGADDDPSALAARIDLAKTVGRLHFAGEATNTDYYGTLQAAHFEGTRAAREVLELASHHRE